MGENLYYVSAFVPVSGGGFTYSGKHLDIGQVFELQGGFNDPLLKKLGYVYPVPANARLSTCEVCGARFLSEAQGNRHATRRHGSEARALHHPELAPTASGPGSDPITVPTPVHVQEVASTLNPKRQHRKSPKPYEPSLYKDRDVFAKNVRQVYFDYCDLEGETPDKEYVAKNLKIPLSVKTMNRYHDYWHLMYPPQP